MYIYDLLFGPNVHPDVRIFNLIMSIFTILGITLTIFSIIMWNKKERQLKRMAKDKVNEVVAREIIQHLHHNHSLEEIKKIVEEKIWKDTKVHVEEVKTESRKEVSQQRIIKITVEDKNENSGFRSFFVKLTPHWLLTFIHERRQAARKRKPKK